MAIFWLSCTDRWSWEMSFSVSLWTSASVKFDVTGASYILPHKRSKPMLKQRWSIVYDPGKTLSQHWVDVSCLLVERPIHFSYRFFPHVVVSSSSSEIIHPHQGVTEYDQYCYMQILHILVISRQAETGLCPTLIEGFPSTAKWDAETMFLF